MSFEEKLIFKLITIGDYVIPSNNGILKTKYISEKTIKENCLDKQKVKEGIDKLHPKCECKVMKLVLRQNICLRCELLKEFGLECGK